MTCSFYTLLRQVTKFRVRMEIDRIRILPAKKSGSYPMKYSPYLRYSYFLITLLFKIWIRIEVSRMSELFKTTYTDPTKKHGS